MNNFISDFKNVFFEDADEEIEILFYGRTSSM